MAAKPGRPQLVLRRTPFGVGCEWGCWLGVECGLGVADQDQPRHCRRCKSRGPGAVGGGPGAAVGRPGVVAGAGCGRLGAGVCWWMLLAGGTGGCRGERRLWTPRPCPPPPARQGLPRGGGGSGGGTGRPGGVNRPGGGSIRAWVPSGMRLEGKIMGACASGPQPEAGRPKGPDVGLASLKSASSKNI